ncbi:unnamed protein product [Ilex paraguariensis]|uniref:Uncharacterized protein n=1 Tax=Ilex paraguariensis TaxID=185542 RepID=A0ABC8UVT5_9AQUA
MVYQFILPSVALCSFFLRHMPLQGGRLKAVIGAAGGSSIPAAIIQVFQNHFVKGKDPLFSVMAPRYYHLLYPNVLYYESYKSVIGDQYEAPAQTRAVLKKKGHKLRAATGWAICTFVVLESENSNSSRLVAVSDPRKGGFPAGY